MKNEIVTPLLAKEKIVRYCNYQERCKKEIIEKLKSWHLEEDVVNSLLVYLIEQDYINEQRFANAFTIGKLRQLGWGKIKIKHALRQKNISDKCINKSIKTIDETEYLQIAEKEMKKKLKFLKQNDTFTLKFRLISYMQNKGFEFETVEKLYNEIKNK